MPETTKTDSSADGVIKTETVTTKIRQKVLFWPESCQSPEAGFAVGWKHVVGSCEQVLVAGVLALKSSVDSNQQITKIREQVRLLIPCHCCTCADLGVDMVLPCAGCTRKQLDGIDVVAFYDDPKDLYLYNNSDDDCKLPVFSGIRGFPFWLENDETATEKQLIFFPDLGRDNSIPVFQSKDSASSTLYTQLEYASTLMDQLRQSMNSSEVGGSSAMFHTQPTLRRGLQIPCPHFIAKQSLFLRHVARSGLQLPAVELFYARHVLKGYSSLDEQSLPLKAGCCVCDKQTVITITHRQITQRQNSRTNQLTRLVADLVLGALLGCCIVYALSGGGALHPMVGWYFDALRQGMAWLNSFPVGFKLNERLTATLSHQVCLWFDFHEAVITRIVTGLAGMTNPMFIYAAASSLGGFTLLALLIDALQLGTLHMLLLAMIFGRVFQTELSLLHALWCLFRGKKRNVLRNRTDTMEYDSTQLLFGTILFVAALFLFTTCLVYHLFFVCGYFVVTVILASIQLPYAMIQSTPFGTLDLHGNESLAKLFLEHDEIRSSETVDVTTLRCVPIRRTRIAWDSQWTLLYVFASHLVRSALCLLTGSPVALWANYGSPLLRTE